MKKTLLTALLLSSGFANSSFSQASLDKGLVAYYPFNGNAKDESNNGNNASVTNVSFVPDRFGKANSACYFDGKKNYIRIPNDPSLNFKNGCAVSAWVMVKGFYGGKCHGNRIIMKGYSDQQHGNLMLTFDDNVSTNGAICVNEYPDRARQSFYATQAPPITNDYIVTGKWYLLTYTYDGTTASLYVDCKLQGRYKVRNYNISNGYDLFFGKMDHDEYPYWFNGLLDEVRIYNRPLDITEINTLCNLKSASPVPLCTGSNLVSAKFNFTVFDCTNVSFELSNADLKKIQSIQWNFSDGQKLNWLNPVYDFKKYGNYKVTAIVTSKTGCKDTVTREIKLRELKTDFSYVEQGSPGQLQFKVKNNSASYAWDFGDGSGIAKESVVSHSYQESGQYSVRLFSRNSDGCVDTVQKNITITLPVLITEAPEPDQMIFAKPTPSMVQLEKRNKDIAREILVENDSISISLFDNGVIDGDSITLIYNNEVIATKQPLKGNPLVYTLRIDRSKQNELVMYADNLGSIPPNTAMMIVRDNDKRYEVNISSTKKSNGAVIFTRKQ